MNTILDEKKIILAARKEVSIADMYSIPDLRVRLLNLKKMRDMVEARKNEIIKPLRESIKSAQELFKPIEKTLEESDAVLRSRLLVIENQRIEQEKEIAKQVAKGEVSVDQALVEIGTQEKGLFRTVKKLKITSKAKIPDAYWIIDEVKLRAALMGGVKVPGAKLIEEKTVVAK